VNDRNSALSKVPAVTLGFWIIKIAATTLGETGGDTVTMTMDLGYLTGTLIFLVVLVALVAIQISARKFHPFLYWATIVASTTLGTTLADFADRSLGIGYTGGSTLLLACVLAVLAFWYRAEGTVSVDTVSTPRVEMFYWATITFSQTLGTALGDWMADSSGFGYLGAAAVFLAALAIVVGLYSVRLSATSSTSRTRRAGSISAVRSPRRFFWSSSSPAYCSFRSGPARIRDHGAQKTPRGKL